MESNGRFIVLLLFVITQVNSQLYDVHWLNGTESIRPERDVQSLKQNINIYCYSGTGKNLLTLWQTVKFQIKIKNDEFSQYFGENPEEVYKDYKNDYGWVYNPFQKKPDKTVSLDIFKPTCMAVNTKQNYNIELHIQRVDLWRVLMMIIGVSLIFASRSLSGNPVFFYLCGIVVGVSASFMVLVYYVTRFIPGRTLTYGLLIGGWTVGVYLVQQLWENIQSIVASYKAYLFWYTLIAGFISFVICYRVGPPKNQRSKNLVMWTLQAVGALVTVFSSQYQEASTAVAVLSLGAKYFPKSLLYCIQGYWRRRFPPRPRLLSDEEYYEQGARETKRALDQLRQYCASPDCKQWSIMLKLHDSKRFASFVEGDSHLSDDEVINYESYAFSMEHPKPVANSTRNMEISDDDSDYDDDD